MAEKRYYQRDYEELYYIIDSQVISEKDFDERVEYDGYNAFEDSLTGEEIVGLLNENEQLKQQLRIFEDGLKSEIKQTKITMEDWHECLTDCRKLKEENEQLKQRNDKQYNQLKQLWELIEDEDYNTLRSMLNQRETDEKLLQKEWGTYSD